MCAREGVLVASRLRSHRAYVQFLTLPPMACELGQVTVQWGMVACLQHSTVDGVN